MKSEELCSCNLICQEVSLQNDLFFCSYCKKLMGVKLTELKPLTDKDISDLTNELKEIKWGLN